MILNKIKALQESNAGWQLENYMITNIRLGKGSFGEVFEGKNISTNTPVAIKIVPYDASQQLKLDIIEKAKSTNSPFIVKLFDIYLVESTNLLYLVFEKCDGSLRQYIMSKYQNLELGELHQGLSVNEAIEIFCQLAEGCIALWDIKITYHYLKPDTILYHKNSIVNKNVFVITTLGLAKNPVDSMNTHNSMYAYMAPEVIKNKKSDYRADVWSIGVILHELLFGPLHHDKSNSAILVGAMDYEYKLSKEQAAKIPPYLAFLLKFMIMDDPEKRLKKVELKLIIQKFEGYNICRKLLGSTNEEEEDLILEYKHKLQSNFNEEMEKIVIELKDSQKIFAVELDLTSKIQGNEENLDKLVNYICASDNILYLTLDLRGIPISLNQLEMLQKLPTKNRNYKILLDFSHKFTSDKQLDSELNKLLVYLQSFKETCRLELDATKINVDYKMLKSIYNAIDRFQCTKLLRITKFEYEPYKKGTNEEITTLSNVFTHSKTFQHLQLDFGGASITTGAIDHLAGSINKMDQMVYLKLMFYGGNNSTNNNSMRLFAQAIKEMPNLCRGNNKITDDGIMQLGQAIGKSTCIQQLILDFMGGKNGVTDKGIEELSQCIGHLHSIQQLKLCFGEGNHAISDEGIQTLAAVLKNTNNISDLYLNFDQGNNSITDASMNSLVGALKLMSPQLSITLRFESNNKPNVTANGESIIANARAYNYITFYHNGQRSSEN